MRTSRVLSSSAAVGTALGAVASLLLVAAPAAAAGPPVVEAFDVAFPDPSCATLADPVVARLHVRFTEHEQPDGTAHHWVDLDGTITNEASGAAVDLRATRRFFDDAEDDQSRFAGLQSRFSAPEHGVLELNAGWAAGALSEAVADYATRGRWDGIETALPESVCAVLAGG